MVKALSVNVSENLLPLSRYLWAKKIPHRISENGSEQTIWVAQQADTVKVADAYECFRDGTLEIPQSALHPLAQQEGVSNNYPQVSILQVPITTTLILLSILVTWGLHGQNGEWVYTHFKMQPVSWIFENNQPWRLFTPVLLHFGILHLVFNMLIFWTFGRQLENRDSSWTFLVLVLFFGITSNLAQYLVTGSEFGGMSGVVYAVVGYCWVSNRMRCQPLFYLPNALMGFMLGWLLVGFTDLLRWVGFGSMANAAHLTGLVVGMMAAWLHCQMNKSGQT